MRNERKCDVITLVLFCMCMFFLPCDLYCYNFKLFCIFSVQTKNKNSVLKYLHNYVFFCYVFDRYLRMSPEMFESLLHLIGPGITK